MSRRALLGAALAALLLLASPPLTRSELDGFEADDADASGEEEDGGFGASAAAAAAAAREEEARAEALRRRQQQQRKDAGSSSSSSSSSAPPQGGGGSGSAAPPSRASAASKPARPMGRAPGSPAPTFFLEAFMAVMLILYGLNFWVGKVKNERIAMDWAHTFCSAGAIMDRNFSLLGPGDTEAGEIMMKESHSTFKFYASGRRYCKGMLATLELRSRQDMLSYLLQYVFPKDDTLEVEVYMNDASMPPVVFAIGHTRDAKALAKERRDMRNFANLKDLRDRMPKLDSNHFACYTESKEIAGDIITQALDDIVTENAWQGAGQYLQSALVSSESSTGTHKKIVKFTFKLPPPGKMDDLQKALSSVPSLIDAVGSYKINSETKKRAEERRRKASEAALNTQQKKEEREELIAKKRAEKAAAEKERLARMTPEARAKAEEKQEALLRKRNSKFKVKMSK